MFALIRRKRARASQITHQSWFQLNKTTKKSATHRHIVKHGLDWICKTSTGFVKHGFVKGGFVKYGFVKHGFVKGGFVKRGFVKHGFVKHGFVKRGFVTSHVLKKKISRAYI